MGRAASFPGKLTASSGLAAFSRAHELSSVWWSACGGSCSSGPGGPTVSQLYRRPADRSTPGPRSAHRPPDDDTFRLCIPGRGRRRYLVHPPRPTPVPDPGPGPGPGPRPGPRPALVLGLVWAFSSVSQVTVEGPGFGTAVGTSHGGVTLWSRRVIDPRHPEGHQIVVSRLEITVEWYKGHKIAA